MPDQNRTVRPGPDPRSVRTEEGRVLRPPADWELLPPGDPGLTRRVKAAGPSWTVQEKVGRKMFSRGVWAPAVRIAGVRAGLERERATEGYGKKLEQGRARREKAQGAYVEDFRQAVLDCLRFSERYAEVAGRLADAVTAHATPVGSGTVART